MTRNFVYKNVNNGSFIHYYSENDPIVYGGLRWNVKTIHPTGSDYPLYVSLEDRNGAWNVATPDDAERIFTASRTAQEAGEIVANYYDSAGGLPTDMRDLQPSNPVLQVAPREGSVPVSEGGASVTAEQWNTYYPAARVFNTISQGEAAQLVSASWFSPYLSTPTRGTVKKESKVKKYSSLWVEVTRISSFLSPISSVTGITGFQKEAKDDFIGVEFENELRSDDAPEHEAFRLSSDNSLRNHGVEYVLYTPAPISAVKKYYTELLKKMKKYKPNNTSRASTHVHFDVSQMKYTQLLSFASCYFFCEELLSHFAGESRQNNLFCLRLIDSKEIAIDLIQEMQSKNPLKSKLYHDNFRYGAVNFASVSKFGSLEFRMFPAVSEPDDLDIWIEALNNIRLFSLRFNSLVELNKYLIDTPAEHVLSEMIGKAELEYILKDIKRTLDDKEVLSWSRTAFCLISPIFDAAKDLPTEKDLEIAIEKAEIDEKKILEQIEVEEKRKKEMKKFKVYVYPQISSSSDTFDQEDSSIPIYDPRINEE